ncbi:MAG: hypothetical protein HQL49_06725 [Gammaproteobacteria bacterium]|nr:hypothetical protein [Gammaproteobacteria bacterium]
MSFASLTQTVSHTLKNGNQKLRKFSDQLFTARESAPAQTIAIPVESAIGGIYAATGEILNVWVDTLKSVGKYSYIGVKYGYQDSLSVASHLVHSSSHAALKVVALGKERYQKSATTDADTTPPAAPATAQGHPATDNLKVEILGSSSHSS